MEQVHGKACVDLCSAKTAAELNEKPQEVQRNKECINLSCSSIAIWLLKTSLHSLQRICKSFESLSSEAVEGDGDESVLFVMVMIALGA